MIRREDAPFIILFVVFIILAGLCYMADAAKVEFTTNAEGYGAMWVNSGEKWDAGTAGDSKQYNGGSSGDHMMSGVGQFSYSRKDTLDATVNNRYTQSGKSTFTNGLIFDSYLSMEDASANVSAQSASAEYGGYLTDSEVTTAKFVNDANMSMGQEAAWNGVGLYSGEVRYKVELGTGENETVVNYVAEARKRQSVSTNATGGAIVRQEFDYTDFADSYMANSSSDETTNTNLGATQ